MMSAPTPAMRLSELLTGLIDVAPLQDPVIRGLTLDSRAVEPGFLFLAVPGARVDGRRFIAGALARGAVAVVYEAEDAEPDTRGVTAIGLRNLREHAVPLGVLGLEDSPQEVHALV